MDTKFAVALHILALLSTNEKPVNSAQLGFSVGTNPSFIRKILGLLKTAGLIESTRGKSGYALTKDPADISLLSVYQATHETEHISLFTMHKHPNAFCPVGKNITGALSPTFAQIDENLETDLASRSLQDILTDLRTAEAQNSRQ